MIMAQVQSEMSVDSIKRQYSGMTPKDKFKFFISCLVITACSCGLLFQLFVLCRQYFSRQTVVSVQVEITKFNKIPAFTVCFPNLISMDLAAQKYPEVLQLYEDYTTLVYNSTEITPEERKSKIQEVYGNFTDELKRLDLPVNELFDISLPFGYPILSQMLWFNGITPISITIKGIRYFRNNNTMIDIELEDKEPIESIVIGKDSYKCFTFFNMLNKRFRNYQIDEKEILIEVCDNS